MLKHTLVLAATGAALAVVGCSAGGDGGRDTSAGDVSAYVSQAGKPVASVDPCALLTKEEVVRQVELSKEPGQLEALRGMGVVWDVVSTPEPRGVSRACHVAWRGMVNDDARTRGSFSVVVTDAAWLRSAMAGETKAKSIAGVGDEAYFVGGSSGPPYARVGDVAVGIEEFPDTREAKSGLDLLRAVVPRVRGR